MQTVQTAVTRKFGLRPRSSWDDDLPRAVSRVLAARGLRAEAASTSDLLFADPTLLRDLAGQLTVAETFFFRHKEQLEEAVNHVGSLLRSGRPGATIWSAGCSTGEEAYSLLMMLTDAIGPLAQRVKIVACDINREALETARSALYGDWSLRGVHPELSRRHFTVEASGKYRVLPSYRGGVEFVHLSVLEMGQKLPAASVDVVVFRNVGVYLEPAANEACHSAFARVLQPDGVLIVAPTDPAPSGALFRRADRVTTSVYSPASHPAGPELRSQAGQLPPGGARTAAQRPHRTAEQLPHVWAEALLPLTQRVVGHQKVVRSELPRILEPPSEPANAPRPSMGPKIAALGNSGRLQEALGLVEHLISSEPTSSKAWLLRAQLQLAASRTDAALDDLRRALFLDPEHRIARYWYAVVLRGLGRTGPALAQLRELERRLSGADGAAMLEDGHTTNSDLLRAAEWLKASTE